MKLAAHSRRWISSAILMIAHTTTWGSPGLDELLRIDRLAVLRDTVKVGSVSSYDRSGGNDDGFSGKYSFVRKDGDGLILADLKGPGVITRVWTPTPSDDVLQFYFDGETKPRVEVKFRDLFLGRYPAFPKPLVGAGAGGYYCYVPMPFAKSCVVRMQAPKVQFYQINYALHAEGTSIRTFEPTEPGPAAAELARASELWSRSGSDIADAVTPPGTTRRSQTVTVALPAHGTKKIFEARKGGRIVGMRLWPASAIAGKGRDLLLKVTWDGEAPAAICPVGDFFGYAWGQPAMQSLLVGTTGETNYCYFPMPFSKGATIELVSERDAPVELHAEVLSAPVPRATNEGRFYALWRRENPTTIGEPFTFLDTAGRGHLVGLALQSQGFESGKTLFFEGDDQTTIDGELVVHGTGSEDFFNGGWYDVPDRWEKRLSFPMSGCLGYAKHLGRTGAYRIFLADAYAFRRGIRQTIEHAGEKNSIPTDYCSVTYFYSEARPTAELKIPSLKDRAVVDLTELEFPMTWQTPIYAWSFSQASLTRGKVRVGNEDVNVLSLRGTNSDWFGPHFLSPVCEVPAAGRYAVQIEAVRGPAQALVQLFQNENPVADPVDLYAETAARSGTLTLGTLELAEGRNNLMLKLVGKNDRSSGLGLDLIRIVCVKQP